MNKYIHTSVQKCFCLIRLRSIVNRAFSLFSALIVILISLPLSANAQEWPVKPIKLIVSFPAGSSPAVVGRAIAVPLSQRLGQPVVIENRSGATGMLGANVVAKSAPDGYTFLVTSGSSMTITVHTMANIPFDTEKDLIPVAAAARIPLFLVVRPSLGVKNYAEFIAYAKSKPGKLSYATPGNGSAPHVATEMLKSQANFFAVHVPYRGASPALQDLLGDVIDFAFDPGIALNHVRAGRLILLAVGSAKRSLLFPDTPTMQELGLKNFDADTTHAFYAPAGTPSAIVEKMNKEINATLAMPSVAQQIRSIGAEPTPLSQASLRSVLDSDRKRFGVVVKERAIKED